MIAASAQDLLKATLLRKRKSVMFGKCVIRLGDPTTHGGVVVSAASDTVAWGKQVARMGDHITCPIPGHGGCVIVEGDPTWTIDGRPVALEGHLTSCGAALISTLNKVWSSSERNSAATAGTAGDIAAKGAHNRQDYDEQTQLIATPIKGVPYFIEVVGGRTYSGTIGDDGRLPRVVTHGEDEYTVYWGDDALAKMNGARS